MTTLRREYEGPVSEALWDFADEKHIRSDDYGRDLINDAGDLLAHLHDLARQYDEGKVPDYDLGPKLMQILGLETT